MAKNSIKLTESELHNIIKESVKKVILENQYTENGVWDLIEELKETIGCDALISRLISRMSPEQAMEILEEIYEIEVGNYNQDEEEF